jgi:hypothetical protein
MTAKFDPYHKWLAIPASERPIHFYRLLGVPLFEDDTEVISVAADRQMAHVKTFSTGKYAEISQRILNELSQAKICLTNFESKLNYDTELRKHLRGAPRPEVRRAGAREDDLFAEMNRMSAPRAPAAAPPRSATPIRLPARVAVEREFPIAKIFAVLLLLLLGLVLAGVIIQRVLDQRSNDRANKLNQPPDGFEQVSGTDATLIADVAGRSLGRFDCQIYLRDQPTVKQSGNHYLVRTLAFRDGDLVECELEYWRDDGPDGAKWRLTKLIVDNEVLHESP